ncbi:MAG: nucleotidyl transferase AbiEii/AbiGii toxin family protein [Flavobacteriaceae bacterium]|jgi:hypothetical protein|nr:nucleotidyl transferase AbiEii/AbiGii toxin family protein [Flavobacteriaceae bacterium]
MHLEILSEQQKELLPFIALFKREYYMVGGTAIALHIGHRESIDFDLFKEKEIRKSDVFSKIYKAKLKYNASFSQYNQINLEINQVKFTFFQFPYNIPKNSELKGIIKMPDLLTLAAMKAFALGRRSKWKDYVDLYFLIKYHFSAKEIAYKADELFKGEFVKKQFMAQIGYFGDINYNEKVTFLVKNPPSEEEIKAFLIDASLSDL